MTEYVNFEYSPIDWQLVFSNARNISLYDEYNSMISFLVLDVDVQRYDGDIHITQLIILNRGCMKWLYPLSLI